MPIDMLVVGESVRLDGINADHARTLAEVDGTLPPILVHRRTMRVIDGLHRLHTARQLGRTTIDARFFDGDDEAAFLAGVQANIAHGRPLSLADRTAAAARLVRAHPEWSDRRIAGLVGLSPKTVGAARARLTEEIPQSRVRVGRDGRPRRMPAAGAARRESTAPRPAAAVAEQPFVPRQRRPAGGPRQDRVDVDYLATYRMLRHDPSFRMTETGRFLLRLLDLHSIQVREWDRLIETVPRHSADSVADLARHCAHTWWEFAERIAEHADETPREMPAGG
ncbi:ParB/RepB/Spo0J family partition protein [Kutzneria kofuensis]|uniref:ParB-like N-terminal domain-containing protein n=1 Tax=Kutzneria kofuensis TaxID=103725 RepID=A0A7W9KSZ7_9PSEU|nr:ParB N-terminal domain-containing protein [Kutzneria kofuensis]MBB5898017.1 hypothetical protein [Kutzneria kofuensis]